MFPVFDQNPPRNPPVVTRALIAINVFFFLLSWWMERRGVTWINAAYGMVPSRFEADPSGEWIKSVTSMFLHADFMHILWNMMFLFIFGKNVEDALGKTKYLVFYFGAGIFGAFAQVWVNPGSSVPMVGASGAIAGVLAGYLVLHPRAPVTLVNPVILLWLIMGPFFVLPAWMVVGWWFVGNLVGGLASLGGAETDMAFFAHIGGFGAGLLLIRPMVGSKLSRDGEWTTFQSPPRVRRKKIFPKDEEGPFWEE